MKVMRTPLIGVRCVRHYFVDSERMWPIGWNEVIDSLVWHTMLQCKGRKYDKNTIKCQNQ